MSKFSSKPLTPLCDLAYGDLHKPKVIYIRLAIMVHLDGNVSSFALVSKQKQSLNLDEKAFSFINPVWSNG